MAVLVSDYQNKKVREKEISRERSFLSKDVVCTRGTFICYTPHVYKFSFSISRVFAVCITIFFFSCLFFRLRFKHVSTIFVLFFSLPQPATVCPSHHLHGPARALPHRPQGDVHAICTQKYFCKILFFSPTSRIINPPIFFVPLFFLSQKNAVSISSAFFYALCVPRFLFLFFV